MIRAVWGRATCTRRSIRSGTLFRAAISGPGARWTSFDLSPHQAADLAEVLRHALEAEKKSEAPSDVSRDSDGSAIRICGATASSSTRTGRRQVVVAVTPHEPGDFKLEMTPAAALALARQLIEAATGKAPSRRIHRWLWWPWL